MRIFWKHANGNLAITGCVVGVDPAAHAVELHSDMEAAGYELIGVSDVADPAWPIFDDWRWDVDSSAIVVDFAAAQESTANRLRAEREPLLAKLDTLELIARRRGEDLADIFAEKQRLCDITIEVSACTTLEQLAMLTVTTEFPGV